mmetsp:Transcript_54966/g.164651  ORF Transcript_54966/g.164651 Transcript_54966/m.164651 type:complete len:325 (-) Transcript_54966:438-1412(-)
MRPRDLGRQFRGAPRYVIIHRRSRHAGRHGVSVRHRLDRGQFRHGHAMSEGRHGQIEVQQYVEIHVCDFGTGPLHPSVSVPLPTVFPVTIPVARAYQFGSVRIPFVEIDVGHFEDGPVEIPQHALKVVRHGGMLRQKSRRHAQSQFSIPDGARTIVPPRYGEEEFSVFVEQFGIVRYQAGPHGRRHPIMLGRGRCRVAPVIEGMIEQRRQTMDVRIGPGTGDRVYRRPIQRELLPASPPLGLDGSSDQIVHALVVRFYAIVGVLDRRRKDVDRARQQHIGAQIVRFRLLGLIQHDPRGSILSILPSVPTGRLGQRERAITGHGQ